MNEFQNKSTKRQYLKSKLVVKRWEDDFAAKNGRLPTRADIKLSPVTVRESYNIYYKIKTQLLASQILTDDLLREEFECEDVCNKSSSELNISAIDTERNNTVENIENIDSTEVSNKKSDNDSAIAQEDGNISESEEKINPKTWGAELNVKKTENKDKPQKLTSLNILSQKLFKGSTFKKRNPRRAPSFNKSKLNKSNSQNSLNSQSQEVCASGSLLDSLNSSLPVSGLPTDAPDDHNESLNKMNSSSLSLSSLSFSSSYLSSSSFLSSSSITSMINKPDSISTILEEKSSPSVHKLSLIQEIATAPANSVKCTQNYQEGWVERCLDFCKAPTTQRNSDSGFDSMENSPPLPEVKERTLNDDSSDDDFIIGSDNEQDENSRSSIIPLRQKRKATLESKVAEEVCTPTEVRLANPPVQEVHVNKKFKLDSQTENSSVQNGRAKMLERKIQAGTLNENYVKINLEKKTYVRGKKNFNFSKYKKQQWKKSKKLLGSDRESGGVVQCYTCGEVGHFTRSCKKNREDSILEVDEKEEEDTLPTLEQACALAEEKAKLQNFKLKSIFAAEKPAEEDVIHTKVDPIYQLNEDGSVVEAPSEVYEALSKFGHAEFRHGQEQAIMRTLSGLSTLLMISTGGGKSLCYQLPAYLYARKSKCITLVISPLVSLMEDQVTGSSSFFKAGCLHTSQTQKQREAVLEDVKNGKLHALLISPEAVVSGDTSKGFGGVFKELPPIAFACIDEVHCISQWSHNFRPSYLMINRVLREKFGVTTILGLTATATVSSVESITKELGISSEKDVIRDIPVPNNIYLSISKEANKDEALIQLLKSPEFMKFNAILIYCTRRDDCERLAVLIRTVLQTAAPTGNPEKNKRLSWNAESYHAGMAAARRKQVQKAFMSGNLRIVVATVAFGMGINKQDIRAVIHYNMPRDFESYVQELGRAGRDGLPAHCHLFLDPNGRDLNELRRHIYANSIDRFVLRKLLQRVFIECNCREKGRTCEGHEVAFKCDETIQTLDIPEENISTLLCYLELHEKKFIKVLAPAYINCKLKSYKGISQINSAALNCPPLAYVCAMNAQSKKKRSSILEFNVMEVANKISWKSGLVKSQLKNLEWEKSETSTWKKTGISVEFHDLGFRVLARGDMTPAEQDEALDYLTERVESQEKRSSNLLNMTFSTLHHFASRNFEESNEEKSEELKKAIRHYFDKEQMYDGITLQDVRVTDFEEDLISSDVRTLLCTYRDNTFNARAVARIFHGIQSPNYPASLWFKCRYWRKHMDKDFNRIIALAKLEILRLKL